MKYLEDFIYHSRKSNSQLSRQVIFRFPISGDAQARPVACAAEGSRHWKTTEGETKEATDWFNVESWGRLGEICEQYLSKGRLVYLEGRLKTDRFEKDGEIHYFTKVVLNQMQMLDKRPEEDEVVTPVIYEDDYWFE